MGRILIAVMLTGALALTACSTGGGDQAEVLTGEAPTGAEGAGALAPDAEEPAGEQRAGDDDAGTAADEADASGPLAVAAIAGRQVIHRAHLTLESDDPEATAAAARRAAEQAGGFVSGANLSRVDGALQGSMTLRVPAGDLQATLDRLRGLEGVVTVTDERLDSEDVTGQITDVESQLRNLRAVESELRALLAEIRESSSSADQVLSVFSRIREVRAEIERLEGRRTNLADLVELATVNLQITPAPTAVPAPESPDPWLAERVVSDALNATVTAFQGLATAGIWLGLTALPIAAVTLGPVAAGVWALRRRRVSPDAPADAS